MDTFADVLSSSVGYGIVIRSSTWAFEGVYACTIRIACARSNLPPLPSDHPLIKRRIVSRLYDTVYPPSPSTSGGSPCSFSTQVAVTPHHACSALLLTDAHSQRTKLLANTVDCDATAPSLVVGGLLCHKHDSPVHVNLRWRMIEKNCRKRTEDVLRPILPSSPRIDCAQTAVMTEGDLIFAGSLSLAAAHLVYT